MSRDIPAAHLQIDQRRRPGGEFIERLALATDEGLQHQTVAAVLEAVRLQRCLLGGASLQTDWRRRCLAAETHVDEIGLLAVGQCYRQKSVRLRPYRRVRGERPDYPGAKPSHTEAEFFQHVAHQPVLFVAVATAE